jgi:polysaccharide biosynthesis/export protein
VKKLILLFIFFLFSYTVYAQDERPPGLSFVPSANTGTPATVLKSLKLKTKGEAIEATIEGDGVLLYCAFALPTPARVVVDVLRVRNQLKPQVLPTPHPFFERASFYDFHQKAGFTERDGWSFSRVVFELKTPVPYRVTPDGHKLLIELLPETTQAEAPKQDTTKTQPEPPKQSAATKKAEAPKQSTTTTRPEAPKQSGTTNPGTLVNPGAAAPPGSIEPSDIDPQLFFGPAPPESDEYKLGPEDVLQINVFQLPELNVTVRVTGSSTITLPLTGTIFVKDMTANQLAQKIAQILGDKYLQNPNVTVYVNEYNSQKVSVIGGVKNPGAYALIGNRSLIQLIVQAGGMATIESNTIFIFRQTPDGRTARLSVPVKDLLVKGDPKWNIWLKTGDVISVPSAQQITVSVMGAVGNPGLVTFADETTATLLNAIARTGGLKGASKTIKIRRRDPSGIENTFEANFGDILSNKKPDVKLQEGDIIIVKESFF